jgi:Fic family protein
LLREPLLYLSLYLKQNRSSYYELLDGVRSDGDWERWLAFFAQGVRTTAEGAVTTAHALARMFQQDRDKIQQMGRSASSALRVHEAFRQRPVASIDRLVRQTRLTVPTVTAALRGLESAGIVREITGRKRNRLYSYESYLALLQQGTEPL